MKFVRAMHTFTFFFIDSANISYIFAVTFSNKIILGNVSNFVHVLLFNDCSFLQEYFGFY